MKHILMVLTLLITLGLNAQTPANHGLDGQVELLKDLLAEQHISQFEYNRRAADLRRLKILELTQQPALEPSVDGPGGTSTISGVVTVDGLAQVDVQLNLVDNVGNFYAGFAMTNALGEYTFSGLPASNYHILANNDLDDYINAIWSTGGAIECQYCAPGASSIIVLGAADAITLGPMDLTIGATINGQVTDGLTGLDNTYVNLAHIDNQSYYGNGTTDVAGNYSIKGVPAGDYYVRVQNTQDIYIDAMWTNTGSIPCSYCEVDANSTITLAPAEIRNGIDFSLLEGASFSGLLVDQDTSAAVETLRVEILNTTVVNQNWFADAVFDGLGGYTVSGIPQGDYKVYLSASYEGNDYIPELYNNIQCNVCGTLAYNGSGDTVTLVNGANTANIDFMVEVGASISGAILINDHLPDTVEKRALIYVFNDTNRVLATQFILGTDFEPAFDGSYKVGGLLPGTYFVQGGDQGQEFYQRELYNGLACPWSGCDRGAGGTPVILGANEQRVGVNFLLDFGGKISGTVTDASTGLPIPSPNETQFVQFYDASGQVAGGAAINADGTYLSQRALPAGTYSVRTGTMFNGAFNSPYVMQKYMPGPNIDCPGVTCDLTTGNVNVSAYARLVPRDPIAEAAAATVTGIDFALAPGFSFSGTISELGSSDPIPDVHVLVFDASGNFANWASTDVNGDFTVSGLPAGTYYALTNNGSNLPFMGLYPAATGGWIDILFDGTPCPGSACDVTTGTPIVLGGAPSIDGSIGSPLDFSLSAGGTISGQVRDFVSQLPASNIDINVYHSSGAFYGSYQSDNDGNYLTVGLPAGTYFLTTSNDGAMVDVKYGGDYCVVGSCDPMDAQPLVISADEDLVNRDFILRPDFIFKANLD